MDWTQQMLAQYFGPIKTVVEFKGGITGDELERLFHDEALFRLAQIRNILCVSYMDDKEKIKYIWEQILEK